MISSGFRSWARRAMIAAAACAAVGTLGVDRVSAADQAADRAAVVQKGVEFLKSRQDASGAWSASVSPAITALVVHAMLQNGVSPQDPAVQRAVKYLEGFQQEDGGYYAPESKVKNYETAVMVLALTDLNADGKYDAAIKKADALVRGLQWDEGEGKERDDPFYGGAGYGGHSRPDLSNTSFMLDALKAAGADEDDPAIQKALVFVSRTQNLESQYNTTPFSAKVNDGGFYYTPAAGGTSQAGPTENGGLRSYGSMTYAGLKSMIYAGVDENDPRVKAAINWLKSHYTLEENPNMGQTGVYYYFNTFAKALDAVGEEVFVSADGTEHRWKDELVAELAKRQKPDGSWINEAERWYESDPNLATAYSLLALSYAD
ncbi:MAG TPA: prenyltransferase/squalene oxidase repeat-containing protein [Pirellulaceae bacterium]|nr:prenyltransferase/squalene oxidase repeat-containing protein [Pirellulaceae bacterium]